MLAYTELYKDIMVYALRCFVEFKLGSTKSFALDRAALLFVKEITITVLLYSTVLYS